MLPSSRLPRRDQEPRLLHGLQGWSVVQLGGYHHPEEKEALVQKGYDEVEQVINNYNMGFITNNERYNQVIDIWTHVNSELSNILMKTISSDDQGFNSVYMMLDSGAVVLRNRSVSSPVCVV